MMKKMLILAFLFTSCGYKNTKTSEHIVLPLSLLQTQEIGEKKIFHFAVKDPSLEDKSVGFDAGFFQYFLKFSVNHHGFGKIRGLYLGPLVEGSLEPIILEPATDRVELTSSSGFSGPLGKITSLRLTLEYDEKIFDSSMLPHNVILEMLQ